MPAPKRVKSECCGAWQRVEICSDQPNEITCSGGCSYAEEFAADLPEAELRASP